MKYRAWMMVTITAALLAPLPALAAYQCPAADPTADKPTLEASDMAGAGVSDRLKSLIHRMAVAGTKSGNIVDKLVAAACGRIEAESNVSDDGKAEQVRRFASKIATFVYSTPGKNEEDIVLDVPVPTPLYNQLHEAAAKTGVSDDAWVNEAITAKLGKP